VGLRYAQVGQQQCHRLGPHGRSAVGMQPELAWFDILLFAGFFDQLPSQFGALARRHHPADNVTAENVEDDVEIKVAPLGGAAQLGDVPTPKLVTQSLKTIASIANQIGVGSIFVSGTTLLVASGTELLYFDTTTLQQMNSVTVPYDSWVFGVSLDGSKIYLGSNCLCGGPETMEVVDFLSGQTLVSQAFPNVNLYALRRNASLVGAGRNAASGRNVGHVRANGARQRSIASSAAIK
jgi:hypothetical protein